MVLTNDQTSRIFVDDILVIAPVRAEDSGTYICTASNPEGQARASAELLVAASSSVLRVELRDFSNPTSQGQSVCHETRQAQFEVSTSSSPAIRTSFIQYVNFQQTAH